MRVLDRMNRKQTILLSALVITAIIVTVTLSVTLTKAKNNNTIANSSSSSGNSNSNSNVTSIYFANVPTRSFSVDFSQTTQLPNWLIADNTVVGSNGYTRQYQPQNILFQNGTMILRVPGGQKIPPVLSAQIRSVSAFQYGHARMVAQLSSERGTCQSLFMYQSDYNEIDIEIIFPNNASSPQLWCTVQPLASNKPIYHIQATLPSTAATSFHEYGIVWTSARVYFLVDGVILANVLTGIPTLAANVYFSNWADANPSGWPNGNNTPLPSTNSDLVIQSLSIVSPL